MKHTIAKHVNINATGINIATATCSCGATDRGIEGYIRHWSMLHLQSVDDEAKGESQESIGVQSIPALTSIPRHGATATPSEGAETVALSSDVDALLASMNLLALKRLEACTESGPAYAILDGAYQHLNRQMRKLLTGGAL